MRDKQEILEATHRNALNSDNLMDVLLIHSLHTLEVHIDIRDLLSTLTNVLISIRESGARLP